MAEIERIDVQPGDPMYTEPALTIGQVFADKAMIKTYIAAAVSLVAFVFKVTVDDAMVDNITTLVSGLGIIVTAALAQYEARKRATAQARVTRAAVYAPATVERIADQQYDAGKPPTEAQPRIPPPADV